MIHTHTRTHTHTHNSVEREHMYDDVMDYLTRSTKGNTFYNLGTHLLQKGTRFIIWEHILCVAGIEMDYLGSGHRDDVT